MPILSLSRVGSALRRLVAVSRPDQWLVTAVPFAAGYVLSAQPLGGFFWLGVFYLLWPYNLLIHGTDALFVPSRSAALPRRAGLWILLINAASLAGLIWLASPAGRFLLAAMGIAATAFGLRGLRLRDVPLLDALAAGFLTSAPLLLALTNLEWQGIWLPAVIALALWGAAQYCFGSLRQMHTDRAEGGSSTALLLEPHRTVTLSVALFVAAGAVALYGYGRPAAPAAIALGLYTINAARFLGVRNPELFGLGWKALLTINYLVAAITLALLLVFLD